MNMEGETICGYYVSPEQKKINAVYIDLILEFGRLCEQAGLTWWMYGGGLIGAVRHKGFIPWDDDIDLLMPRADFDRLRAMTNEEFGARAPFFLQNFRTEPSCVNALVRFRRSDTADIRPEHLSYMKQRKLTEPPYNMGINLAVFPLDAVPKSEAARKLQKAAVYLLWGIFYRAHHPEPDRPVKAFLCRVAYHLIGGMNIMKLTHWLYRSPRRIRFDEVQNYDGLYSGCLRWPKSDFDETVQLPFEDIEVPAPAGYDDVLRKTYGDYLELPPEEQRSSPHGSVIDPDRPYPEVLAEILDRGSAQKGTPV